VSTYEDRTVLGDGVAEAKLAELIASKGVRITILCNDQCEPRAQRQCHATATNYVLMVLAFIYFPRVRACTVGYEV